MQTEGLKPLGAHLQKSVGSHLTSSVESSCVPALCCALCSFFHELPLSTRGTFKVFTDSNSVVLHYLETTYLCLLPQFLYGFKWPEDNWAHIFLRVLGSGLHFSPSFFPRYSALCPLLLLHTPLQRRQCDIKASVISLGVETAFCINLLKVLIKTKQVWDWGEPSIFPYQFLLSQEQGY